MKKILLASAALVALIGGGVANAADMPAYKAPPPAPYYSWTGFYFGGLVGPSWGKSDATLLAPFSGTVNVNGSGVQAGATVGANYQVGYWVFGVEADYAWTNYAGSKGCNQGAIVAVFTCHSTMDSIGTVTGRLGYAWDRVLLFAKGGGAWSRGEGNITANATGIVLVNGLPFFFNGGQTVAIAPDNRSGWTLGGGMEFGFWGPWSAKVEYDYIDFGTKRATFTDVNFGITSQADVKERIHAVKFGVNYRLGYGPVYANY
jgi:outer membrane immunogenic protein